MKDHIRRDDFVFQFGMLALVSRVLVATHIPPRPAEKSSLLYMGDVVGDQIVSQSVAFVYRTPQLVRFGIDCHSHTIANAVGVNSHRRTVRIELENIGSILFLRRRM